MKRDEAQILGSIMESEIAEIPAIFQKLSGAHEQIHALQKFFTEHEFRSVQILARGTSDNAAQFLKYLIETKLGIPVGLTSPSAVTIYRTKLRFSDTLVVAISQSGQSTDLVEYAKAACTGGAKLISITNDQSSPLAQLANHHIDLMAGKELAVAATKSYAAQLFASLLVMRAWGVDIGELDEIIYASQRVWDKRSNIMDSIALCERANEIVVLGRGFSYPNAREIALKIQETSKISVQGLSIADYMHGPISALTSKTQVFLMVPHGLPLASIKQDVAKIRTSNPKIFWFGYGDLANAGDIVIDGARCANEIFATVADVIILQSFALEFARKNKLNPDAPAGLNKVTFTR
jgi:glucosamine--fructose-6-phosphate aminotransferase (isomerizing)